MPSKANVIVEYGPYKSNGIVDYKEDRLIGLKKYLEKRGHKVIETKRSKNWNNVNIFVNEQNVFKCNINDLEFAGDGELDPLVIEAEKQITNAY